MLEPAKRIGAERFIISTVILAAGIACALAAHTTLQALQRGGLFGSSYLEHSHNSVGVVAALASLLLLCAAIGYALRLVREGSDGPIVALARNFGATHSPAPYVAVALVALTTLGGMEWVERLIAHSSSTFLSAYGSTPAIGMAIVAAFAGIAVASLRGFSRRLAAAARRIFALLAPLFVGRSTTRPAARIRSRACARVHAARFYVLFTGPDRAPPTFLA